LRLACEGVSAPHQGNVVMAFHKPLSRKGQALPHRAVGEQAAKALDMVEMYRSRGINVLIGKTAQEAALNGKRHVFVGLALKDEPLVRALANDARIPSIDVTF
jgi:hypothetical protein